MRLFRNPELFNNMLELYDSWAAQPERQQGPLNATRALAHTIMNLADTRPTDEYRPDNLTEQTRNGVVIVAMIKGYPQSELHTFLDDLIEAEEKWRKKHGYAPIHSFERVGLTELIREREWN